MQTGTFFAVSVGCGSADMLTIQALEVLKACSVICFPETSDGHHIAFDAVSAALDVSAKELLFCPMPMTHDSEKLSRAYSAACEQCAARLRAGTDVAFVALGDVSLYATAAHVASHLAPLGFPVRYIAGVTSITAAACACALELAGKESPVTIIPADAYIKNGKLVQALRAEGTKVFMKAGKSLPKLLSAISAAGLLDCSYLVQNVSLDTERRYCGNELLQLPAAALECYLSIVIVLEKRAV